MRGLTVTFKSYIVRNDVEVGVTVQCYVTPGYPGCGPAYDHGGLPPEPPEVDIESVEGSDEEYVESLTDDEVDRFTETALECYAVECDEP